MAISDSNKSSEEDEAGDTSSKSRPPKSPKIHRQALKLTTAEAQKFIADHLQRQVEVTISNALEAAMNQMHLYNDEAKQKQGQFEEQLCHGTLPANRARSHSTPIVRPQSTATDATGADESSKDDDDDDSRLGGLSACPSAKEPIALTLIMVQISLIVLFGFMVKYDEDFGGTNNEMDATRANSSKVQIRFPNMVTQYYQQYQDIQVMVFLGIGVLMSFIRKYGYSAIGFTMLAGALAAQWSIIVRGIIYNGMTSIPLNIVSLINGDFAAAVVLISYGVVIGVASPLQLIFMTFVEVLVYVVNEYVGVIIFQAVDTGGSIFVHVFAAYFGLGVSRAMRSAKEIDTTHLEPSYNSNIFCLVSVVFLWLFWPSFNSALSTGIDQDRVVVNTMLSLFGSCIAAFAFSALFNGNKFILSHVQNASLAGGVAVGAVVDLMIRPCGALTIGVLGGFLCVFGCQFISPLLNRNFGLHDSCGVHNLHGLPGLLAGLGSVLMAAIASECEYGPNLYLRYPARSPPVSSERLLELQELSSEISPGIGRTGMCQAMVQLAVLGITLGVSLVGGAVTGLLMRLPIFKRVNKTQYFRDSVYFEMEKEDEKKEDTKPKTNKIIEQNNTNKVKPINSIAQIPAFGVVSMNSHSPPIRRMLKKYEL